MSGPLQGVRVLELTMNLMGPFGAQILGDMGADVWKVEPLDGDTTRGVGSSPSGSVGPLFLHVNRNKRSVALDIKSKLGRAAIHRGLTQTDVLLYSMRPAAMQRLGLAYEDVAATNPRIIHCGVFGYGQSGPYAALPAYDDLIQGLLALPWLQAGENGEPVYINTTLVDRTMGIVAASAVGMALYHRERTGKGQAIELPMLETMAQYVVGDHLYGMTFDPPTGTLGYPRLLDPFRRPYRTRDGYLCMMVYTNRHWQRFFEMIGRPDMAADPRYADIHHRTANIRDLFICIKDALTQRTTSEWLALLREADIPAAPLNTPEALLRDPHLEEVGFFRTVDHPSEGRVRTYGISSTWSESMPEVRREAPQLGEHTVEVLREWGCQESEIDGMLETGVVRTLD